MNAVNDYSIRFGITAVSKRASRSVQSHGRAVTGYRIFQLHAVVSNVVRKIERYVRFVFFRIQVDISYNRLFLQFGRLFAYDGYGQGNGKLNLALIRDGNRNLRFTLRTARGDGKFTLRNFAQSNIFVRRSRRIGQAAQPLAVDIVGNNYLFMLARD